MSQIVVDQLQYYAMLLGLGLVPAICIFVVVSIFRAVPWALPMYNAFRKNMPVVMKHHPRGSVTLEVPRLEKDMPDGIPVTYYKVDKWGIKFPDVAGDNTELLNGKLRIIHYFKNNPAPVNIIDTVSIDALMNWLISKGVNVTNREDTILFLLSEYVRTNDLQEALESCQFDSEDTKMNAIKAIKIVDANRKELENLLNKDRIFVFQSAMSGIDRVLSFTSASFSNAKSAIEASMRAKLAEDKNKEIYKIVLMIFVGLICAAIAYVMISKSEWGGGA